MPFCWHNWYILRSYPDYVIEQMVTDPNLDPDEADVCTSLKRYKEKICLKCKKYVDEITSRYNHYLQESMRRKREAATAKKIVKKLRLSKKPWEKR